VHRVAKFHNELLSVCHVHDVLSEYFSLSLYQSVTQLRNIEHTDNMKCDVTV